MLIFCITVVLHFITNQVSASVSLELSSICRSEGRFPTSRECEEYVECVAENEEKGNSSINSYFYRCPTGPFHPTLARCVVQFQGQTCRSLESEALRLGKKERQGSLHRSPRHDRLCVGRLGFACASCTEVVVCAGQEAFLSTCASDMRCMSHDKFPGGVCYPRWPKEKCSCKASGQVMPDIYDRTTFLQCSGKDHFPRTFYCNNMHIFDPETLTCKAVPDVPACFATGVFPVEHACRWYYSCMPTGAGKWYQDYFLCPGNKVYNQAMAVCVDPQSLPEGIPCSSKRKTISYKCNFLQLILVFLFPKHIAYICSST
ncbi:uncharacterized protein LOC123516118 [Portunus trituberculatus]|uniref:uncharacterized protein LOC123516118 n=1 Tax=Portunus trituberculatus TaxID=210409 RepID=UPI001E1CE1D1|nr:uncharacterized protein LOC123516118 [Portunus trituberculatus]